MWIYWMRVMRSDCIHIHDSFPLYTFSFCFHSCLVFLSSVSVSAQVFRTKLAIISRMRFDITFERCSSDCFFFFFNIVQSFLSKAEKEFFKDISYADWKENSSFLFFFFRRVLCWVKKKKRLFLVGWSQNVILPHRMSCVDFTCVLTVRMRGEE